MMTVKSLNPPVLRALSQYKVTLAHDKLAGERMWAYHQEGARAQVAEHDVLAAQVATKAIQTVDREAILKVKQGAVNTPPGLVAHGHVEARMYKNEAESRLR